MRTAKSPTPTVAPRHGARRHPSPTRRSAAPCSPRSARRAPSLRWRSRGSPTAPRRCRRGDRPRALRRRRDDERRAREWVASAVAYLAAVRRQRAAVVAQLVDRFVVARRAHLAARRSRGRRPLRLPDELLRRHEAADAELLVERRHLGRKHRPVRDRAPAVDRHLRVVHAELRDRPPRMVDPLVAALLQREPRPPRQPARRRRARPPRCRRTSRSASRHADVDERKRELVAAELVAGGRARFSVPRGGSGRGGAGRQPHPPGPPPRRQGGGSVGSGRRVAAPPTGAMTAPRSRSRSERREPCLSSPRALEDVLHVVQQLDRLGPRALERVAPHDAAEARRPGRSPSPRRAPPGPPSPRRPRR